MSSLLRNVAVGTGLALAAETGLPAPEALAKAPPPAEVKKGEPAPGTTPEETTMMCAFVSEIKAYGKVQRAAQPQGIEGVIEEESDGQHTTVKARHGSILKMLVHCNRIPNQARLEQVAKGVRVIGAGAGKGSPVEYMYSRGELTPVPVTDSEGKLREATLYVPIRVNDPLWEGHLQKLLAKNTGLADQIDKKLDERAAALQQHRTGDADRLRGELVKLMKDFYTEAEQTRIHYENSEKSPHAQSFEVQVPDRGDGQPASTKVTAKVSLDRSRLTELEHRMDLIMRKFNAQNKPPVERTTEETRGDLMDPWYQVNGEFVGGLSGEDTVGEMSSVGGRGQFLWRVVRSPYVNFGVVGEVGGSNHPIPVPDAEPIPMGSVHIGVGVAGEFKLGTDIVRLFLEAGVREEFGVSHPEINGLGEAETLMARRWQGGVGLQVNPIQQVGIRVGLQGTVGPRLENPSGDNRLDGAFTLGLSWQPGEDEKEVEDEK